MKTIIWSWAFTLAGTPHVALGQYDFDGATVTAYARVYRATDNPRPLPLARQYPGGPGKFKRCVPSEIYRATGRASLSRTGLVLTFPDGRHVWDKAIQPGAYYLRGGGGWAVESDPAPRHVDPAKDLHFSYVGESLARGPATGWAWAPLRFGYHPYLMECRGDTLARAWRDRAGRVFGFSWFRADPRDTRLVVVNGGHDFNGNGVLDEYGHQQEARVAWAGWKVRALFYVEASYQNAGVPLLGAGYYAKNSFFNPRFGE